MTNSAMNRISAAPAAAGLLDLDPVLCAASLGHSPMLLHHHVADHPLLELGAIAALADSLPSAAIECLDGPQELVAAGGKPLPLPSPSAAVLGIESSGCWMVMKNIEQNPQYRRLLDTVLDQLAPMLPAREGRMGVRESFLFLSAPGAITPVHVDPEHNVLLHVRGSKKIGVGSFPDRSSEQLEIKRYLGGGHRNLMQIPSTMEMFTLRSGDALYMPPWRPHCVENGAEYSVSLSMAFRTRRSDRYEYTHIINSRMERLGLSPCPAGRSLWRDELKASYVRGKRWLRNTGRALQGAANY